MIFSLNSDSVFSCGPSKASISFTPNDECIYQVSKDGKYYVTIKYNGEHIPFSPFTVYVTK